MLEFLVVNLSILLPQSRWTNSFILLPKKNFTMMYGFNCFEGKYLKVFICHGGYITPWISFFEILWFHCLIEIFFWWLNGFSIINIFKFHHLKKNCVTMFLLPTNAILLCKRSLFHIWWIMLILVYIRKGVNFIVHLNVDFVHSH
jgi:hypothetical protein